MGLFSHTRHPDVLRQSCNRLGSEAPNFGGFADFAELGEFTVPVKLHKDVTAHLKVVIEKEAVAE